MTALLVVLALAAAVAAWVLAPLFRPGAAEAERTSAAMSDKQDLLSQREMALAALRDLEDDRQTGKIGDADYEDLKARLSSRAVEILDRIERLEHPGPRPAPDRGAPAS